jgi:hypothetical protein
MDEAERVIGAWLGSAAADTKEEPPVKGEKTGGQLP